MFYSLKDCFVWMVNNHLLVLVLCVMNVVVVTVFFLAIFFASGVDDPPYLGLLWVVVQIPLMVGAGIGALKIGVGNALPLVKLLVFLMATYPVILTGALILLS